MYVLVEFKCYFIMPIELIELSCSISQIDLIDNVLYHRFDIIIFCKIRQT